MKPSSRQGRRSRRPASVDQIRQYIQCLIADHEQEWTRELHTERPEWIYLLGLHLRLAELEHLEPAGQELF